MKTFNVSLVGVGGQGILLTADLLAKTAAIAGMDVKKSEIHGMAQRGGSVIPRSASAAKSLRPSSRRERATFSFRSTAWRRFGGRIFSPRTARRS